MKIALLITTHKRPHITREVFENLTNVIQFYKAFGLDLQPFIAVSDDENREVCEEYNFDYILTENKPLGLKHQTLLDHAMRSDWSYMMQMGSDNIISKSGHLRLIACMVDGIPFFGFNTLYFWKWNTQEVKKVSTKMIFGAGRCIRRDLIAMSMIKNQAVWRHKSNRGLDGTSQTNIGRAYQQTTGKIMPYHIIHTPQPCVVDIKSDVNITPWESFNGKKIDFEKFTKIMFAE